MNPINNDYWVVAVVVGLGVVVASFAQMIRLFAFLKPLRC